MYVSLPNWRHNFSKKHFEIPTNELISPVSLERIFNMLLACLVLPSYHWQGPDHCSLSIVQWRGSGERDRESLHSTRYRVVILSVWKYLSTSSRWSLDLLFCFLKLRWLRSGNKRQGRVPGWELKPPRIAQPIVSSSWNRWGKVSKAPACFQSTAISANKSECTESLLLTNNQ